MFRQSMHRMFVGAFESDFYLMTSKSVTPGLCGAHGQRITRFLSQQYEANGTITTTPSGWDIILLRDYPPPPRF